MDLISLRSSVWRDRNSCRRVLSDLEMCSLRLSNRTLEGIWVVGDVTEEILDAVIVYECFEGVVMTGDLVVVGRFDVSACR